MSEGITSIGGENVDALTLVVTALVGGAAAMGEEMAEQAARDAYKVLKGTVTRRFGHIPRVQAAIQAIEERPTSEVRQELLKEELAAVGADEDTELARYSRSFLELLSTYGVATGPLIHASITGGGAIAQGAGAVAAGEGGVAISGDAEGGIQITNKEWDEDIQVDEDQFEENVSYD
jgi:hypothetical protein